jgi:MFS family permease
MTTLSRARGSRFRPVWLHRDLGLLFGGRALRSISQAFLAIIVPLYLARLQFSAVQIGALFSAGAVASALLSAAVGILSDRIGRKKLLVLIALLSVAGGLVFALTETYVVLVLAGALGTIGRGGGAGSGGAMGPFAPAEQALIGEHAGEEARTTAFGVVSFVGVLAGAVGSLVALVPAALKGVAGISLVNGYRVLFILSAVIGVAIAVVVAPVRERRATATPVPKTKVGGLSTSRSAFVADERTAHLPSGEAPRGPLGISRASWGIIGRFMITNAANGLAVGVLGPFMVYWFFRRFGTDAAEMGVLFFIINLAGAAPDLLAGGFARKLGAVNAVVVTRSISVALLAIMAIMPTFLWAAALYLVRMVVNTLSNPIRQSYLMGIIDPRDRSSAAGLSNMPSQAGAAISPTVAGYLMQQVSLNLPLELAAGLQGINALLYYLFFRNIHPPEEREEGEVP